LVLGFRNELDGTEPAWAPYLPAAELLIDCGDRTLRAVLIGMLREADR
jgi:hypothetical protein